MTKFKSSLEFSFEVRRTGSYRMDVKSRKSVSDAMLGLALFSCSNVVVVSV